MTLLDRSAQMSRPHEPEVPRKCSNYTSVLCTWQARDLVRAVFLRSRPPDPTLRRSSERARRPAHRPRSGVAHPRPGTGQTRHSADIAGSRRHDTRTAVSGDHASIFPPVPCLAVDTSGEVRPTMLVKSSAASRRHIVEPAVAGHVERPGQFTAHRFLSARVGLQCGPFLLFFGMPSPREALDSSVRAPLPAPAGQPSARSRSRRGCRGTQSTVPQGFWPIATGDDDLFDQL